MNPLIRANLVLLDQGLGLLSKHDSESFVLMDPTTYGSGIGAHFRHVLDHYFSFLNGVGTGVVDYDARERGTEVERDLEAAKTAISMVKKRLQALRCDGDRRLDVKLSSAVEDPNMRTSSSVGRELQFLVSHTVHHYALIAIASRLQRILPPSDFGVAPSTLKYLQAQSVQA